MIWAALIPALPLIASLLIALTARRLKGRSAGSIAVAGSAIALILAIIAAIRLPAVGEGFFDLFWFDSGERVDLALWLDSLSVSMAILVALVSLLVQIYAVDYMAGEARIPAFFALLSLFEGAMLTLVLSGHFLLLYIAWEVVGLASYMLIGFERSETSGPAATQAFLVTRIGDLGLLLGIILLWTATGSLRFPDIFSRLQAGEFSSGFITVVALLLFLGAAGKSAQVPLQAWLPDAMAGPTPVSALIHSATMVAAGVYLVARVYPLFQHSQIALQSILWIGALTSLLGAAAAVAQTDLKRILAYSTISQLGEMMLGLGAGATQGVLAHLGSHALFKSTLFLAAGLLTQPLHTNDLFRLRGAGRLRPLALLAWVLAGALLAGVSILGPFWSKDLIWEEAGQLYPILKWIGFFISFLSGLYIFRPFFILTLQRPDPSERERFEREIHQRDWRWANNAMKALMILLIGVALWQAPGIGAWLRAQTLPLPPARTELKPALVSLVFSLAGIGLSYMIYGFRPIAPWRAVPSPSAWTRLALGGFGFDWLYKRGLVQLGLGIAVWMNRLDRILDRLAKGGELSGRGLAWFSSALDRRMERFADVVTAGTVRAARLNLLLDEQGFDRAVEASASRLRDWGGKMRRLQTGEFYHYVLAFFVWIILTAAWLMSGR